jgi:hypothetical protein
MDKMAVFFVKLCALMSSAPSNASLAADALVLACEMFNLPADLIQRTQAEQQVAPSTSS